MFNENNIKELRKSPLFLSSKISFIVSDWNHEITELLYDAALNKLL